jgi:hypothetical protein
MLQHINGRKLLRDIIVFIDKLDVVREELREKASHMDPMNCHRTRNK